ncbi:hypothetical protein Zmor_014038 [Zophobas morio]|uniref:Protein takeout n=2 Tax=Zophobas morio TaxID=2755281 RepID=A0AA38IEL9_9CUCU|nr:hypothetical protein Zmor_014038 [Zophobas morio]
MKHFLMKGITEFNFPPISPFYVPEVHIHQGGPNDSVSFNLTLKDVVITGFDSYEFEKFDFDPKTLQFDSELKMGALNFKAKYVVNGKVLTIPLDGKGNMNFTITTSSGTLKQNASLTTRKGQKYLTLHPPSIHIDVGDVTDPHYDGLFDGNEVLAKAVEKVLQDYQKELGEEMKPTAEKIIEQIIYDLQQKLQSRLPYDEVYPVHEQGL